VSRSSPRLAVLALALAIGGCDTTLWLGSRAGGPAPSDASADTALADLPPLAPCLVAEPDLLTFAALAADSAATLPLRLRNTCAAPRAVTGFYLGGDRGYTLQVAAGSYPLTPGTGTEGVRFDPPIALGPGATLEVAVSFEPAGPERASASIIWLTDDAGGGPTVALVANAVPPPCIAAFPKSLEFGAVLVGTERQRTLRLGSCASAGLLVHGVLVEGADAGAFTVLDPAPGAVPPPPKNLDVLVRVRPDAASLAASSGAPQALRATLVVQSNAFESRLEVPISALAVSEPCPWPVIAPVPPAAVPVGATLTLDSASSVGVLAGVERRAWSATGPRGLVAAWAPASDAPVATVRLDAVGSWTLRLAVWDADGRPGCTIATHTVEVLPPPAGLHVELTWQTPGDLDPTDDGPGAGADIDLHLRHPLATGLDIDGDGQLDGWFDVPFDAHWLNPTPDWGQLGVGADDPRLWRDDTDGEGPELIALLTPPVASVTLGAHTWDDHGYGPSDATVSVWLDGLLLGGPRAFTLSPGELCVLATVTFADAQLQWAPAAPCAAVTVPLAKSAVR
jgi:hypothetical protein